MDDERRIREELDRLASEVPPTAHPPGGFRARARWRMARTGAVGVGTLMVLVAGGLAVGHAVGGSPGVPASGPRPAASDASPARSFFPHIAFQSDRSGNEDIWIMDTDGTNLRNLTNDPAADSEPEWSPDGTRIAFVSDRGGNPDIYVMAADGSNVADLTNTAATEADPAWSPDGSTIAYDRNPSEGPSKIWVMDSDGANQHPLANDSQFDMQPTWSPDGSKIAYSAMRNGIWAMNADGSARHRLTRSGSDISPDWCSDGAPIAFVRIEGPASSPVQDMWYVSPSGGDPGRVTHLGDASDPAWSASGTMLAFVRYRDASSGIFLMNVNGSGVHQLTPANDGVNDSAPAWQPPVR